MATRGQYTWRAARLREPIDTELPGYFLNMKRLPSPACFVVAALACGVPFTIAAQSRNPPKRPRLTAGADTNSARAYYDAGVAFLKADPPTAAAAFYWASRLAPSWPEAFYARRVAGLLSDEHLLMGYLEGEQGAVRSRQAQALDSLEYQAQRINPFFLRDLDEMLLSGYVIAVYKESRRRAMEPVSPGEEPAMEYLVNQYLQSGTSLSVRAAIATSRRQFGEALEFYRQLLAHSRIKAELRILRARIFYSMASYDSALVEMQGALDELRQRDTARTMPVYVSRELLEHSIGIIDEAAGDTAAARAAYGRALLENLSFAPAHTHLAVLDLLRGDTATALSEWDLAIQVAPEEAPLRTAYGLLLAQTGRGDDAVLQLDHAVELEPFYAIPHYLLGYVAELQARREVALQAYRAFLARASVHDRLRATAEQRVAALSH